MCTERIPRMITHESTEAIRRSLRAVSEVYETIVRERKGRGVWKPTPVARRGEDPGPSQAAVPACWWLLLLLVALNWILSLS